jgi:hypothetical protein
MIPLFILLNHNSATYPDIMKRWLVYQRNMGHLNDSQLNIPTICVVNFFQLQCVVGILNRPKSILGAVDWTNTLYENK